MTMSYLKKAAGNMVTRGSELERKLKEACSNENWGCPNSLLAEIGQATWSPDDYRTVMSYVWATMGEPPKMWRRILKALNLLEYLLKSGSERCIDEARDNLYKIRSLEGFHHEEEGKDKGVGLREKAKAVAELLNDRNTLREEREKCRQLRDKFVGIAAGAGENRTFSGGAGRYDGFGGGDRYSGGGGGGGGGGGYDPYIPKDKKKDEKDEDRDREKRETRDRDRDKKEKKRDKEKDVAEKE